jgi:hypothetical protein
MISSPSLGWIKWSIAVPAVELWGHLLIRVAKIESKILCRFGAGAGSFFEGYIADVEGTFETLGAFEEAFYGEELDAGIF